MGLFGKKTGEGLGMLGTLAGLALVSHLLDTNEKETRVVHEYVDKRAEQEEERREREHERQMEKEKKRREAESPNDMEFINERINEGEGISTIGAIAFLVFDFALLLALGGREYIIIVIVLAIVGVFLVKFYFDRRREREIYKEYASLIVVQNYRSIMEIATKMNCNYEETLATISKIITKGYVKGFHIDKNKKILVEQNKNATSKSDSITKNANILKNANNKLICPYCGGDQFTMFKGENCCKYCGGKI
ncbi:MAG: hypothetical protein IKP66_06385 [Lachnospiraceae bacterium]|nr:hypothetical protein [Lachnospiraceae bacterium]